MLKYEIFENELKEQFVKWDDNGVIRFIPVSEANADYQRYLRWLEDPEAEENGTIS